jgi:nitrite reductase/ring-hydroxylating ferredoxin subunit
LIRHPEVAVPGTALEGRRPRLLQQASGGRSSFDGSRLRKTGREQYERKQREAAQMAEVLVCKEGEIADGGVRLVTVGAVEIGVIRHAGKYYAYRNLCPHQGGPACEGLRMPQVVDRIGERGIFLGQEFDESDMHIVCPWHGYEFHLSDGCHVIDRRLRLKKYDVIERNGEVFIAV